MLQNLLRSFRNSSKSRAKAKPPPARRSLRTRLFCEPLEDRCLMSASASFVGTDILTSGNWQSQYGTQGYLINSAKSGQSLPSTGYVNSVTFNGNVTTGATVSNPDSRFLNTTTGQPSNNFFAWANTSPSKSFTISVDFNGGDTDTHQLSLYMLDRSTPPNQARSQTVEIFDKDTYTSNSTNALATFTTTDSANFKNGEYAVFNVSGDIIIKVTSVTGSNAVISGLFFDQATTAEYMRTDTTTQGNWRGTYGQDGVIIAGNTPQGGTPAYATLGSVNAPYWSWTADGSVIPYDSSSLQSISETGGRDAAVWYASDSFNLHVQIADNHTHQLALYFVDVGTSYSDGTGQGRSEMVQFLNHKTGAVLASQSVSDFANGKYLVFNVGGDIDIKITKQSGPNAVLSGMFFGSNSENAGELAQGTLGTNPTGGNGNWWQVYGENGALIGANVSNPASGQTYAVDGVANVSFNGKYYSWTEYGAVDPTDPSSLGNRDDSSRIAGAWYSLPVLRVHVDITDGNAHQLALYLLDVGTSYGGQNRSETVQLFDSDGNPLTNAIKVSDFADGKYVVFDNVSGSFDIVITCLSGPNAVLSGLFFD